MPRYVIERAIPGAGNLPPEELRAISRKSCSVLRDLGPEIQWDHSLGHGRQGVLRVHRAERGHDPGTRPEGGFPADRISEVRTIIDPVTAE